MDILEKGNGFWRDLWRNSKTGVALSLDSILSLIYSRIVIRYEIGCCIMLLSDWYANWKEKRIQAAVEAAKAEAYEEGYADGKSGTPNRTGDTVTRGRSPDVVTGGKKSDDVKITKKKK